jgi:hypothetical protein
MTNIEKIMNQNREKFADECADNLCFRNGRLNITRPFLCGDCEFNNRHSGCDRVQLKAYLLAESEE